MDDEPENFTHTIAIGNMFNGIVLRGLFTSAEEAVEYAEKHFRREEWNVVEINSLT